MKIKKILTKKRYKALMSAYIMIMFGVVVMCYLFGYTSAWSAYTNTDRIEGNDDLDITKADEFGADFSIGSMMINAIKGLFEVVSDNPVLAVLGTIGTVLAAIIVAKAGGAQAFAYIIPIILIAVFANIFIFPIEPITGKMTFIVAGVSLSLILVVFFNLFLFLAIMDFVSGGRIVT